MNDYEVDDESEGDNDVHENGTQDVESCVEVDERGFTDEYDEVNQFGEEMDY